MQDITQILRYFNARDYWTFAAQWGIIFPSPHNGKGGFHMAEKDTAAQWEDRSAADGRTVANMDEYDFMNLLLESRIIQAS